MRYLALLFVAMATLVWASPTLAAKTSHPAHDMNWQQHDTAVYVVSTLNLIRAPNGSPISTLLESKLNVSEYRVFADLQDSDMFYVDVRRDNGSLVGTYVYQMGWLKPRALSAALIRYGAQAAPSKYFAEYHSDTKLLLGTFTSTLPQ